MGKVSKMNKKGFIEKLKDQTRLNDQECIIINDILESHFIIGKKNKIRIISDLKEKLDINEVKANNIYNICMNIIGSSVKDKLKHPFRSES